MRSPTPLTLVEQCAYTDGYCHVFAAALARLVEGTPTWLQATDARQLKQHDCEPDNVLDIHVFLALPDGSVVDAEGQRSLEQLCLDFGTKRSYSRQFTTRRVEDLVHPKNAFLVDQLEHRLRALGWGPGRLPEATSSLSAQKSKRLLEQAREEAYAWWREWVAEGSAPVVDITPNKGLKKCMRAAL